MRLEFVLGLLSTFQVYHQSLANILAGTGEWCCNSRELAAVSAVFPLGQFLGTILVGVLLKKKGNSFSNRQCLDWTALLLVVGALCLLLVGTSVDAFPVALLVCRVVIGVAVGMAFVSSYVAINDISAQGGPNEPLRPALYLGTALLFAGGTALANTAVAISQLSYRQVLLMYSLPSILCGLSYYWHRAEFIAACPEERQPQRDGGPAAAPTVPDSGCRSSRRPIALSLCLMGINATIGVPLFLAYSSTVYQRFGATAGEALHLSIVYPLLQVAVLFVFRCWSRRARDRYSNETVIIIGYGICLAALFMMLATDGLKTLRNDDTAKKVSMCFWFTLLAVGSAAPTNAGICLISEIFTGRAETTSGTVISRAFFWAISAAMSALFPLLLQSRRRPTLVFFPCFISSLILYIAIFRALTRPPASGPAVVYRLTPSKRSYETFESVFG